MKILQDKSGRGNRGSGGKHCLTPIIRYHTGRQGYLINQGGCVHATGWNHYWSVGRAQSVHLLSSGPSGADSAKERNCTPWSNGPTYEARQLVTTDRGKNEEPIF